MDDARLVRHKESADWVTPAVWIGALVAVVVVSLVFDLPWWARIVLYLAVYAVLAPVVALLQRRSKHSPASVDLLGE